MGYIIGLTGGIATGKTTLSNELEALGFVVVDADKITHQQYQQNEALIQKIGRCFPGSVTKKGVNREALSHMITNSPEKLPILGKIVHAVVLKEMLKQAKEAAKTQPFVFFVAPILFEAGWDKYCDAIICLYTSVEQQLERALKRTGMTRYKFDALMAHQWTNAQRQQKATVFISTEEPIEETVLKIQNFLLNFKKK